MFEQGGLSKRMEWSCGMEKGGWMERRGARLQKRASRKDHPPGTRDRRPVELGALACSSRFEKGGDWAEEPQEVWQ